MLTQKEFLEVMHHFLAWVEDWSPWEAHNLIPGTCEGTLYGKKDFADMFKARISDGETTLAFPDGP